MNVYFCLNCKRELIRPYCKQCGNADRCVYTGYNEVNWNALTEENRNRIKEYLSSGQANSKIIELVDELIKRQELLEKGVISESEYITLKREKIEEIKKTIKGNAKVYNIDCSAIGSGK